MKTAEEIVNALSNGQLSIEMIATIVAERDSFMRQCAIAEVALLSTLRIKCPELQEEEVVALSKAI